MNKAKNILLDNEILIICKKTLNDIHSPLKFILTLFLFVVFPFAGLFFSNFNYGIVNPTNAATVLSVSLVLLFYIWTFGLVYSMLAGTSGAPLISEEVDSGTLLILISKPITRVHLFLGKFLALILYGVLLSLVGLFTIGWGATLITSGNINHFIALIPFLIAMFFYSVFVLFLFGSISMAFSSIYEKPRMATIITALLIIFVFLGFLMIRIFPGSIYSTFQLYHVDLGYHLANVFVFFIETFEAIPPSFTWHSAFGIYAGIFTQQSVVDPDQGINLGGLTKTNYYHPIASLLIWIGIALILLIFGLMRLRKREISV